MIRRHLALTAIALTAGCSLVWDMDPYEPRGATRTNADGGGDASSNGGSSGAPITQSPDGGTDAADGGVSCVQESEPNDTQADSSAVATGRNCGAISSVGDIDNWSVVGPAKLVIVIPSGIQFNVIVQNAGSILRQDPGSHEITLGTGTHRVTFQTFDGATGAYEITR